MAANLNDIRTILGDARAELMAKPNVVATGIGYKISQGKKTDELALICSVESKKAKQALSAREVIPATIQNIPTDVYPTGVIHALQDPTQRFRPAPGGVSIGHINITAGTLGCLVKKNGTVYILSNNHVLANSNDAEIGDPILQPGPYDGGLYPQDHIANLSEFIHIEFAGQGSSCPIGSLAASVLNGLAQMSGSKTRLIPTRVQAVNNLVDCAIAKPLNAFDVKNEILGIGAIQGVSEASLGSEVKKSGRTTGLKTSFIQQIDVTTSVSYGSNKTATFVDQLMAGEMSAGGDSGSAVLNNRNEIVGLLFAGSNNTTIINRIQNVFSKLQVTLA
ncbi:MAG: hypothetical protein GXO75_10945 [Calditrichaeota bacterium]|nr:hypothetical protein [Calditrichota bacterium]